MKKTHLKAVSVLAILWMLIALMALTAATYAWFSYSPYANITPMTGTVGKGEGSFLISNRPDGGFDVACDLILVSTGEALKPLSTANLRDFFIATVQSPSGISVRYAPANNQVNSSTLHGTVYLLGEDGSYDVYFNPEDLTLGSDNQALAAMRLGLRITAGNETVTRIFRLDDLGNTRDAAGRLTVPTANTVVASVDESGKAAFQTDPAVQLSGFFARKEGEENRPGDTAICRVPAGVVSSVEYWVYLEGCDENCINDVQRRDLALKMGFVGIVAD